VALRLPRIIPRLDIKGSNVVKGIQMEGLRVVGNPKTLATKYAQEGADELYYQDCVASLYGRNTLTQLLEETAEDVFIPITVAGGIRSKADIKRLLDSGADKVAINTAAIANPELLRQASDYYGTQAIVLSIEARRTTDGWEALTDSGRNKTGKCAVKWALESSRWVGEILLTSVDRDGTRRGFDTELLQAVAPNVSVPVIISGGFGALSHLETIPTAHGVSIASCLHYGKVSITDLRKSIPA
jgi:cyclase